MKTSRNPARSRPLSSNVRRLILLSRASPENPAVLKETRAMTEQDYAYGDLQGNIFLSAVYLGYPIAEFADVFMNSQLAGVIDHSFSVANGMDQDAMSKLLNIPILLKSPETIVAVTMWLHKVSRQIKDSENASLAVVRACEKEAWLLEEPEEHSEKVSDENLVDEYAYAYWLGYIYRCECLLHEESSRMVYGILPEQFMRKTYDQMMPSVGDYDIDENALEICRRIDLLLFSQLRSEEQRRKKKAYQNNKTIQKSNTSQYNNTSKKSNHSQNKKNPDPAPLSASLPATP